MKKRSKRQYTSPIGPDPPPHSDFWYPTTFPPNFEFQVNFSSDASRLIMKLAQFYEINPGEIIAGGIRLFEQARRNHAKGGGIVYDPRESRVMNCRIIYKDDED